LGVAARPRIGGCPAAGPGRRQPTGVRYPCRRRCLARRRRRRRLRRAWRRGERGAPARQGRFRCRARGRVRQEEEVVTRQTDWEYLRPLLLEAIGDTLYMVGVAIAVAAVLGTAMGIGLYVSRRGGLFASRAAYHVL